MRSLPWCDPCWNSAGIMQVALDRFSYPSAQSSMKVTDNLRVLDEPSKIKCMLSFLALGMYVLKKVFCWCVLFQIYTHLKNVFELLSKAVVESKQKVYIPKLSKEEPEEKEESEKNQEGRQRYRA